MTKFKLDIEWDLEFHLFGIACHSRDYRLAWAINNVLECELKKSESGVLNDQDIVFNQFEWEHYSGNQRYVLVMNRTSEGCLVKELKQFDYLLFVDGDYHHFDTKELKNQLMSINFILTVSELSSEEVKLNANFILG